MTFSQPIVSLSYWSLKCLISRAVEGGLISFMVRKERQGVHVWHVLLAVDSLFFFEVDAIHLLWLIAWGEFFFVLRENDVLSSCKWDCLVFPRTRKAFWRWWKHPGASDQSEGAKDSNVTREWQLIQFFEENGARMVPHRSWQHLSLWRIQSQPKIALGWCNFKP